MKAFFVLLNYNTYFVVYYFDFFKNTDTAYIL